MADKHYDFSGWATRNDLLCSDGRTIKMDAFKECDGETVPLVWGHDHDGPKALLGQALLENRPEGVYMYGSFNNSEDALAAKEGVAHGDIKYLSIYANRLKQQFGNVLKGKIREVSLVPFGGANPGAYIDNAVLAHADGTYDTLEDEAVIFTGYELEFSHADEEDENSDSETEKKENKEVAEEKKERTVQDVYDEFTEEQKKVIAFMIGEAVKNAKEGDDDSDTDGDEEDDRVKHSEGEDEVMKYNAFENDARSRSNVICHADQEEILKLAKDTRVGSFQNALREYRETELMHADEADPVGGFDNTDLIDTTHTSFTAILPEYKDVRPGAPELVTNDQGWINVVMSKTHKSPISRIRTGQVDIRNAEQLRAKGYQKGRKKVPTGDFKLARRTTDPQTVYVRNALHRDDIIDITDFDYVQYLYNIDRMMLNEEIATAVMLGDGREDSDADKIFPEHIRPIWTDDDLYTIHRDLDLAAAKATLQGTDTASYFGDSFVTAEAMIEAVLFAREDFKGSGQPDMFITPHMLNVMLLARDRNGRRVYSNVSELASAFNVGNIYTAEQFANKTRTSGSGASAVTKKLHAIIVNLADYHLGSTKGGEVTHFTQFDIDFNQQKSLLETRLSGALTRIYSAIAIEEVVTASNP